MEPPLYKSPSDWVGEKIAIVLGGYVMHQVFILIDGKQ